MAIVVKTGTYGRYYTSASDTSEYLETEYQQVNANYIKTYLLDKGWSINAIAGLIGNLEAESSINPGRWESDLPYGTIDGRKVGVGIVQWTPYTNYTDWVRDYLNKGIDYNNLDHNLARIIYEIDNGLQWINTNSYDISFKEFSTSDLAPSTLAKAFLLNYERPGDQSESVQAYRGELADKWYTYITGGIIPPIDPDIPIINPTVPGATKKKHKGYNFIIFNRKRRFL